MQDENGRVVCNEDGHPFIHTDGTGYISEDLAMMCPKDFYNAKYMKDESIEVKFFHFVLIRILFF